MSATEEIAPFLRLLAPWLLGPALITVAARILLGRAWALRINSVAASLFGCVLLTMLALFLAELFDVTGSPNDPWEPALLGLAIICATVALCSAVAGRILVTFPRQHVSPAAGG
jgi:hypothetical protein